MNTPSPTAVRDQRILEQAQADQPAQRSALPKPPPAISAAPERHRLRDIGEYPDDTGSDRLRIPRDEYPEGFDLQWVTSKVFGQPTLTHRAGFERRGWEPVLGGDFEGRYDGRFLPTSHQGEIEVDGLVLMARPRSWSDRARRTDEHNAAEATRIKDQQIKGGDLPRVTLDARHPSALAGNYVRREVKAVALPIPE
jgi:hypothetical protein